MDKTYEKVGPLRGQFEPQKRRERDGGGGGEYRGGGGGGSGFHFLDNHEFFGCLQGREDSSYRKGLNNQWICMNEN